MGDVISICAGVISICGDMMSSVSVPVCCVASIRDDMMSPVYT